MKQGFCRIHSFLKDFNNLFLFTLHPDHSTLLTPLSVPSLQVPTPIYTVFFLKEVRAPFGYHLTLEHLFAIELGTSSSIVAQLGNPGRGKGPNCSEQRLKQPLLQLFGILHENQSTHFLQICRGAMFSFMSSLVHGPGSLCEPPG